MYSITIAILNGCVLKYNTRGIKISCVFTDGILIREIVCLTSYKTQNILYFLILQQLGVIVNNQIHKKFPCRKQLQCTGHTTSSHATRLINNQRLLAELQSALSPDK